MINIEQPFFDYLIKMPVEEIVVSSICLIMGAFAHWIKKAASKEVPWNIIDYCFRDHVGRSVALAFSLVSAEFTLMTTGVSNQMTWGQLVYSAFSAGFIANSLVNKGTPPNKGE